MKTKIIIPSREELLKRGNEYYRRLIEEQSLTRSLRNDIKDLHKQIDELEEEKSKTILLCSKAGFETTETYYDDEIERELKEIFKEMVEKIKYQESLLGLYSI